MSGMARFLIPALLAFDVPAVHASVYLTVGEAQAQMFGHRKLMPAPVTLTAGQIREIAQKSGSKPLDKEVRAWRASDGGWFILDRVLGKHELITYAVALDAKGAVTGLEILDYRETYGGQVRDSAWRAQFRGKRAGESLALGRDIANIAGATLSSKHITDGVRRILATHALVLSGGHD